MLTFNKEEHKYFWNGEHVPSVTQILDGLTDYSHCTEVDREWGSIVHESTELLDRGERTLESFKEPMGARMRAWAAFKHDYYFKFTEEEIEVRVYHPLYGYAGTVDRARPGIILDIKSGELNDVCGLQLNAYGKAYIAQTGHRIMNHMGVQLKADGTYKIRMYNSKSDFTKFLEQLNKRRTENGSSNGKGS